MGLSGSFDVGSRPGCHILLLMVLRAVLFATLSVHKCFCALVHFLRLDHMPLVPFLVFSILLLWHNFYIVEGISPVNTTFSSASLSGTDTALPNS
jgi:hypothetical protein